MTAGASDNAVPWEIAGTLAGLFGCVCIALQVIKEFTSKGPSSLSMGYMIGFLAIFIFWTLYGIRFRRAALWSTNGLAALLQAALIVVAMMKKSGG